MDGAESVTHKKYFIFIMMVNGDEPTSTADRHTDNTGRETRRKEAYSDGQTISNKCRNL
jgi:hypothetical protein